MEDFYGQKRWKSSGGCCFVFYFLVWWLICFVVVDVGDVDLMVAQHRITFAIAPRVSCKTLPQACVVRRVHQLKTEPRICSMVAVWRFYSAFWGVVEPPPMFVEKPYSFMVIWFQWLRIYFLKPHSLGQWFPFEDWRLFFHSWVGDKNP